MSINRTKTFIYSALLVMLTCAMLGLRRGESSIGINHAIAAFKANNAAFSSSSLDLQKAVSSLKQGDTASVLSAKMALKQCRLDYKRIEFFLDYFFESSSLIYNRPAKVEVDEPYMEYQEPSGFQVIEAMLFDDDPFSHLKALSDQAEVLSSSAADLNSLLYGFESTDQQLLESIRLELIKVITLSITGYDAPELKSGIDESYQSLLSIQQVLAPYLKYSDPASSGKLAGDLEKTLAYLKAHPDFDDFNRAEFLTVYALPLQEKLGDFISVLHLSVNLKSKLNYEAKNIFSKDAIPASAFIDTRGEHFAKAALGKKLFFENALSGNLKRNCASCHRTDRYFSDGLKTSLAFDGKSFVQRNAPSLLYAGFQYAQFWDGRNTSLQEQVKSVMENPLEMNGNHAIVIERLQKDNQYQGAFKKAFPESKAQAVNMENLADAISAFIMDLAPHNSAFDRYMAGDKKALTEQQLKGFNLFMGKAQCGSCHFAPLFNGLIPPLYKRTEYEVLGTPANDDFEHLLNDQDAGRYGYFPIDFYKGAFKTPTVRNAAMTAPYMHNGVFKDLDKVVEFYNQGGRSGLKLDQPQQTLSSKPLNLNKDEVKQIVSFIESLTDSLN